MPQSPLTVMSFPFLGLSTNNGFSSQEPGTCYDAQNVLGYDPKSGRLRGGQRPGFIRYPNAQVNGSSQVQSIIGLTESNTAAASSSTLSTRSITMVAVAGGDVVYTAVPASSYTAATNGSGALDADAPWIDACVNQTCDVYFADGKNRKYFRGSNSAVTSWTTSAGQLPFNGSDRPRLITNWRNRIILSGIKSDPTNWFMSAVDDPRNWDYSPATTTSSQAVAGNNSAIGKCRDMITALITYRNDLLWFGGDHSIHQMSGDPLYGGTLDLVTDITGIAWGKAWCRVAAPEGEVIYFFGSRGGLYAIAPGGEPVRISVNKIDEKLNTVDVENSIILLAWDDRLQHVNIFITPLDNSSSTHYVYDVRNQAFWPVVFGDVNLNPTAVFTLDGDLPADRVMVIGGQDGYVRAQSLTATNDDNVSSTAIDSFVWIGPIRDEQEGRFVTREIQAVIAAGASDVTMDLFFGNTAEAASTSTSTLTRTLVAGRNRSHRKGGFGHAMYIRLRNNTASQTWALESLSVRLRAMGQQMQRMY